MTTEEIRNKLSNLGMAPTLADNLSGNADTFQLIEKLLEKSSEKKISEPDAMLINVVKGYNPDENYYDYTDPSILDMAISLHIRVTDLMRSYNIDDEDLSETIANGHDLSQLYFDYGCNYNDIENLMEKKDSLDEISSKIYHLKEHLQDAMDYAEGILC